MVELSHVSMKWGERLILDDVNLCVHEGDFMAITGPNGGGKTTLLRIMLRLLKPSHGEVIYSDLLRTNARNCGSIGYLPQKNGIDSHFPITVSGVVQSGLLALRLPKSEVQERVDLTLRTIGLEAHASNSIGSLSGGQLQRALLGRALISRPRLLVLDEPLSYIDKRFEHHLYGLLEQVAANTTIVLVSHEMSAISAMANRHIIIDGNVHECTAHNHYIPSDCE